MIVAYPLWYYTSECMLGALCRFARSVRASAFRGSIECAAIHRLLRILFRFSAMKSEDRPYCWHCPKRKLTPFVWLSLGTHLLWGVYLYARLRLPRYSNSSSFRQVSGLEQASTIMVLHSTTSSANLFSDELVVGHPFLSFKGIHSDNRWIAAHSMDPRKAPARSTDRANRQNAPNTYIGKSWITHHTVLTFHLVTIRCSCIWSCI